MTATAYGSADKLPLTGGTLTGTLTLAGSPPLALPSGALGKILGSDASGNLTLQTPGYSGGIDWLDVRLYGAKGDGATDDAAAINAALTAAKPGQTVFLPSTIAGVQTTFAVGSPLFVPPYVTLRGSLPMRSGSSAGGTIKALSTFTAAGIVQMVDQATGGYSTAHESARLIDLTIDGSAIPGAQTSAGVLATGYVHGVQLENVTVTVVPGKAFNTLSNGSGQPYSWSLRNCQALNCGSDGFRFSNLTDSIFDHCRAIGNGRHGFYIGSLFNCTFTGCHAEFNTHGWNITENWATSGSGGSAWFVGCSTDRNTQDGVYIDASGNSPLIFTGMVCRRDGRNANAGGGGYAGFRVNGATTPIVVSGLITSPGVDDNGTGTASPDYGFRAGTATLVSVMAGHLWGVVAGWHDDGTNTRLRRSPNVSESTGTISAPSISLNNPWGWDNSKASGAQTSDAVALELTTTATNTTNALLNYISGGATGLADASKANADAATRFQRDVSGLMKWGDGTNAKDANWYRMGAGTIGTDNSLDVATRALGDVHPRDHSLIAWAYDPAQATGSSTATQGTIYLTAMYVPRSVSATQILWGIGAGATIAVTASTNWVGLFNSAGTLLASVNVDARMTGAGGTAVFTETISSTALTPGLYWVGILLNWTSAGTAPALLRSSNVSGTLINAGLTSAATKRFVTNGTSQTTLTNRTPSSNSAASFAVWTAIG
jgi:hypothetical protein